MTQSSLNRNVSTTYADTICMFILDDDHVRDQAVYSTNEESYVFSMTGYETAIGPGNYDYNSSTEQMDINIGAGSYNAAVYTSVIVPDTRARTANYGESDVYGEIRIVEVLPVDDIGTNLQNLKLNIKTSNNLQVVATSFTEVPTGVYLYEDSSNVPSYSEDDFDYIATFYNYLSREYVIPTTDNSIIRLNGSKNFTIHDVPLASTLGKSFSFKICMNSEGVLYDARLRTSNRRDRGNAS